MHFIYFLKNLAFLEVMGKFLLKQPFHTLGILTQTIIKFCWTKDCRCCRVKNLDREISPANRSLCNTLIFLTDLT